MGKKQFKNKIITRDHNRAAEKSKSFFELSLFVAGKSLASKKTIENVREFCEKHLKDRYKLEVIDIYQYPLSASENQILAVPVLLRKYRLPLRQFVGTMTNTERMLSGF